MSLVYYLIWQTNTLNWPKYISWPPNLYWLPECEYIPHQRKQEGLTVLMYLIHQFIEESFLVSFLNSEL